MRLHLTLALAAGALALVLVPTAAVGVTYEPGGPHYQPAPPPPPPHAKAYGRRCQGQSRKHVKGEKGTAFSRCVKAMAQAHADPQLNPRKACHALSKKHVKGKKGTPFSRCVKEVNDMRKEEREQQV
jgi:hypothetical protein